MPNSRNTKRVMSRKLDALEFLDIIQNSVRNCILIFTSTNILNSAEHP